MDTLLADIRTHWGSEPFREGDCHTLAMALLKANNLEGSLCACIRIRYDENGLPYERGYSHMVYVDTNNVCWDIDGADADNRWESLYPEEEVDKWNMVTRLVWEEVPCGHPNLSDTHIWLQEHYGAIDEMLCSHLTSHMRDYLRKISALSMAESNLNANNNLS